MYLKGFVFNSHLLILNDIKVHNKRQKSIKDQKVMLSITAVVKNKIVLSCQM